MAGRLHLRLCSQLANLITVVVPHEPMRCGEVAQQLREMGLLVSLWSEQSDTCE